MSTKTTATTKPTSTTTKPASTTTIPTSTTTEPKSTTTQATSTTTIPTSTTISTTTIPTSTTTEPTSTTTFPTSTTTTELTSTTTKGCQCSQGVSAFPAYGGIYTPDWYNERVSEISMGFPTPPYKVLPVIHRPVVETSCVTVMKCGFLAIFNEMQSTLFIGTADNGKLYNQTFLRTSENNWPSVVCNEDDQWTYLGEPIQSVGCITVAS